MTFDYTPEPQSRLDAFIASIAARRASNAAREQTA